ncbi:MAG TPA: antibiotic biosynthesis monooxygenase [Bacteroidales bacterium]
MEIVDNNTKGRYAVIFTAKQTNELTGYAEASKLLREKLEGFPGFIGIEAVENNDGDEITVSYWENVDAIRRWNMDEDHKTIRTKNKEKWYANFKVRIALIEREYTMQDTLRK